jgi:hypothetical protein
VFLEEDLSNMRMDEAAKSFINRHLADFPDPILLIFDSRIAG